MRYSKEIAIDYVGSKRITTINAKIYLYYNVVYDSIDFSYG